MLDITQLNSFLLTPAIAGIGKPGIPSISLHDSPRPLTATNARPSVTWRVTHSCNLQCSNCLSDSRPRSYGSELSTAEGLALISDLGQMGVPRLLFAGGEPLLRADILELVAYAHQRGIQPALFTNGTLLSRALATGLKRAGLHAVNILLEGTGREVDCHRGVPGTFNAILEGCENCAAAGISAAVRIPLNRWNYHELPAILDFIESQKIKHAVFAHLVYTGRGNRPEDDLTHDQKRRALDLILERVADFDRRGVAIALSTDENHTDAIYYYMRLACIDPLRAAALYPLLQECGAGTQGAGVGLAGIDSVGDVHPDPYWANYTLGNVRETPFREIWEKSADLLLCGLRNRLPLLKGRCANCRWKQACGGNLRVRADELFGDPWQADPACYLTNKEISKGVTEQVETLEDDVLLEEQAA